MARFGSLGDAGGILDYLTGGTGAGVGTSVADTVEHARRLEEHRKQAALFNKVGVGMAIFFGVAFAGVIVAKAMQDRSYRRGRR